MLEPAKGETHFTLSTRLDAVRTAIITHGGLSRALVLPSAPSSSSTSSRTDAAAGEPLSLTTPVGAKEQNEEAGEARLRELRTRTWLLLLGAHAHSSGAAPPPSSSSRHSQHQQQGEPSLLSARAYHALATRSEPSEAYEKIADDVKRTKLGEGERHHAVGRRRSARHERSEASSSSGNDEAMGSGWAQGEDVSEASEDEHASHGALGSGWSSHYHAGAASSDERRARGARFKDRVPQDALVRMLEAHAWRTIERDPGPSGGGGGQQSCKSSSSDDESSKQPQRRQQAPYVQGMNVLAAVCLYALGGELDASVAFELLLERAMPRYVNPGLDGVHVGLKLVDLCLERLDPPLFAHLATCGLKAELYAFPSVLTLSACTPPLSEALKLWDFLLSYGTGLNVLLVVAQLSLAREQLLGSKKDQVIKTLRTFPRLDDAKRVIGRACGDVKRLEPAIVELVGRHAWDPQCDLAMVEQVSQRLG